MMLPVWKWDDPSSFTMRYLAAATTRKDAAGLISRRVNPDEITRVKGVFATGKPREL